MNIYNFVINNIIPSSNDVANLIIYDKSLKDKIINNNYLNRTEICGKTSNWDKAFVM